MSKSVFILKRGWVSIENVKYYTAFFVCNEWFVCSIVWNGMSLILKKSTPVITNRCNDVQCLWICITRYFMVSGTYIVRVVHHITKIYPNGNYDHHHTSLRTSFIHSTNPRDHLNFRSKCPSGMMCSFWKYLERGVMNNVKSCV